MLPAIRSSTHTSPLLVTPCAALDMNAQLKNFLDSNMRPPPCVGDFLEFVRLMVNPPHGAADAYIHDPVFGNTFGWPPCLLPCCSHDCLVACLHMRSLPRYLARTPARSLACLFARSPARLLARLLARSAACLLARSPARSLVRVLACSRACSFAFCIHYCSCPCRSQCFPKLAAFLAPVIIRSR